MIFEVVSDSELKFVAGFEIATTEMFLRLGNEQKSKGAKSVQYSRLPITSLHQICHMRSGIVVKQEFFWTTFQVFCSQWRCGDIKWY